MSEINLTNIPNGIIIGKLPLSNYLYLFFLKAYNYDEIIIKYHNKHVITAKSLIDGLKNCGWVQVGETIQIKESTIERDSGESYSIITNVVKIEKIGAIRGL